MAHHADPSIPSKRICENFSQKTRRGAALSKDNELHDVSVLHLAIFKNDPTAVTLIMNNHGNEGQIARKIRINQTFPVLTLVRAVIFHILVISGVARVQLFATFVKCLQQIVFLII